MRLKMLFLQILIILPLTTFGERLGYTEELVRDLHAVIKKSGTIGDLINNLPVSDKERKSYWEFIEKYGTENLAIFESSLKSRQIIWKLESGRQIVQDFSRISVGEIGCNGKFISVKGRTLEEIAREVGNLLDNELAGHDEVNERFLDVAGLAEIMTSWLVPAAHGDTSNRNAQIGGKWLTSTTDTLFRTFSQRRQEAMNSKYVMQTTGIDPNACYVSPCMKQTGFFGFANNYGATTVGGLGRSATYLWGDDFGRKGPGVSNLFAAVTGAALPGARRTPLLNSEDVVTFLNSPVVPLVAKPRPAFVAHRN